MIIWCWVEILILLDIGLIVCSFPGEFSSVILNGPLDPRLGTPPPPISLPPCPAPHTALNPVWTRSALSGRAGSTREVRSSYSPICWDVSHCLALFFNQSWSICLLVSPPSIPSCLQVNTLRLGGPDISSWRVMALSLAIRRSPTRQTTVSHLSTTSQSPVCPSLPFEHHTHTQNCV